MKRGEGIVKERTVKMNQNYQSQVRVKQEE
jgi:hypothetical protein